MQITAQTQASHKAGNGEGMPSFQETRHRDGTAQRETTVPAERFKPEVTE